MLPRLASCGTPALQPAARPHGAAPPRARLQHTGRRAPARAARPRPEGTRGTRRGGAAEDPPPAPGRESTPTKKVRAENGGARQSPTLFLRRWGRGRRGCVANSSQMSSGAEARGRLCFQSLKSPALPASLFPSAGRCPGRRSQCARFSGRRGGSGGREGGGEGGWL